jgi:adenosylcobinamide kinase/adenosylcobinamide-phosphate guanylyltransferase
MGKLTFVLGGARSGKSSYAQRRGEKCAGQVVYLATAQALDEEMQQRIRLHQKERSPGWLTLEAPKAIALAWRSAGQPGELVLLDCLTLLVSNLLMELVVDEGIPDENRAIASVQNEIDALLAAVKEGPAEWLIVSNEVGLGLVPPYPMGRLYRDLLGWANQRLAFEADEVIWMVAGIPVPIQAYRER